MPNCSASALGQLLVVDVAHAHGDLAEHLAGALLLLLEQHLAAARR